MPFTRFSAKARLGRSRIHSGAKPMPSPAETSDQVSSQEKAMIF